MHYLAMLEQRVPIWLFFLSTNFGRVLYTSTKHELMCMDFFLMCAWINGVNILF